MLYADHFAKNPGRYVCAHRKTGVRADSPLFNTKVTKRHAHAVDPQRRCYATPFCKTGYMYKYLLINSILSRKCKPREIQLLCRLLVIKLIKALLIIAGRDDLILAPARQV